MLGVLGLSMDDGGRGDADGELEAEIEAMLRERDEARAARDFQTADVIRDALAARGVQIEDTPSGTIWRR